MRRLILFVATLALAAGGLALPARAEALAHVTVRDVEFDPGYVRIEPGDRVRWTWEDGGHSVTSATFDSGAQPAGAVFEKQFHDAGTFDYRCQLHSGMTGTVQVGEPTMPEPIEAPRIHVPSEVPTVAEAVSRAADGAVIVLDPRVPVRLAEPVIVATPNITITPGVPEETSTTETTLPGRRSSSRPSTTTTTAPPPLPERVTITADGPTPQAFVIRAPGVILDSLDVADFSAAGVLVDGTGKTTVRSVQIRNSVLHGNRDYGVHAIGANVAVTDVTVRDARRAAVSLQRCDDCGVVTGLEATGNFVGFEALDAAGVVLRRSSIHGNANGVIVQTRSGSTTTTAGADVLENVIVDNDRTDAPAPTVFETEHVQPAAGVGVWLAGASDSQVRDNLVRGHRWGIVASVLGSPATDDRVAANTVDDSVVADLAWDGVGAGTCFAGNRTAAGAPPTSRPTSIETLYPCTGLLGTTVGVPDPTITTDIAIAALTTYYCRELAAC